MATGPTRGRTQPTTRAPQQRFDVDDDPETSNNTPAGATDDDNDDDDSLDIFSGDGDMVLNLAEVDESKAKIKLWPAGDYDATVSGVEYGSSKKGDPMVTTTFDVTNDTTGETRKFRLWSVLRADMLPRFKQLIMTLAPHLDLRAVRVNELADQLVGVNCIVKIGQDTPKGSDTTYNVIRKVMPAEEDGPGFLD